MTDFRLLQLGKDHRGEPLIKGVPTELAKGVLVTLADHDGNVMVEHTDAKAAAVKVDGKPVYEVAHARPLQVIEVDASRFVLMPPYGTFIHERVGKEVLPDLVAKAAKTKAKPKAKAKAKVEEPRRLKLVYVAAPVLLLFMGLGLALIPEKGAKSAEQEVEADPAAEVDSTDDVLPANEEPTVATSVALPNPLEPIVLVAPPPAPPAQPVTEVAAKRTAEVAVEPAAKPAPAEAATPGKALAPEREAQIRALAESYALEAGFDPEGAAKKLKALKKQVPANARVQKDIDRALKGVGG